MSEHTHQHDEDSACAVAHEPVIPATSATAERTLVAVFASPVAGYLLRYGADMGFRGLLLEPDDARAAGAAALGFPLITAVPEDLDDGADVVVTDHHRPELGVMLRDALATKARWVGIMGNPHHVGPHVGMLTEARRPGGRDRPRASADRAQHRLPDPARDRRRHTGRPARRPQRPTRRIRILSPGNPPGGAYPPALPGYTGQRATASAAAWTLRRPHAPFTAR